MRRVMLKDKHECMGSMMAPGSRIRAAALHQGLVIVFFFFFSKLVVFLFLFFLK